MTIYPSREQFVAVAAPAVRVPVVLEVPIGSLNPVDLYACIRGDRFGCILESLKTGRYSYVMPEAERVWKSRGELCQLSGSQPQEGNPFELLRREFRSETIVGNERLQNFSGGAVGYFGYDKARHIERLPTSAVDDLLLPESLFLFVDRFYEFDPVDNILRIVYLPRLNDEPLDQQYDRILAELELMEAACHGDPVPFRMPDVSDVSSIEEGASLTPKEFESIVQAAKEYIIAGDIFQANLSVRFHRFFDRDPYLLYRTLREINPSPYMSYFDLDEFAIVSASPELLIQVHGNGLVETRPIAGTRPRGATREEDLANARELIDNEKERAEHLMLVDLERNDIGRVARYGTVHVDEFMVTEEYSHVIHIVSNVRGELAEGRDMFDAIIACFPGGTITGAPKVRAMEIIEELEPVRRGIYTGSIGWLGYVGSATLNIAIRTILVKDGMAYIQAGAGIVNDSVPEHEYRESLRKAEAGLLAVKTTMQGTV
jgi:anthranilate/para-aminobenzoate synthase component I